MYPSRDRESLVAEVLKVMGTSDLGPHYISNTLIEKWALAKAAVTSWAEGLNKFVGPVRMIDFYEYLLDVMPNSLPQRKMWEAKRATWIEARDLGREDAAQEARELVKYRDDPQDYQGYKNTEAPIAVHVPPEACICNAPAFLVGMGDEVRDGSDEVIDGKGPEVDSQGVGGP